MFTYSRLCAYGLLLSLYGCGADSQAGEAAQTAGESAQDRGASTDGSAQDRGASTDGDDQVATGGRASDDRSGDMPLPCGELIKYTAHSLSDSSPEGFELSPQTVAGLFGEHDLQAFRTSGALHSTSIPSEAFRGSDCVPGDRFEAIDNATLKLEYTGQPITVIRRLEEDGSEPASREYSQCADQEMLIPVRVTITLPGALEETYTSEAHDTMQVTYSGWRATSPEVAVNAATAYAWAPDEVKIPLERHDERDLFDKIGRSERADVLELFFRLEFYQSLAGTSEVGRADLFWSTGFLGEPEEVEQSVTPEELEHASAYRYRVAEADVVFDGEAPPPRCHARDGIVVNE